MLQILWFLKNHILRFGAWGIYKQKHDKFENTCDGWLSVSVECQRKTSAFDIPDKKYDETQSAFLWTDIEKFI